ncbi:MAG: hypothetical protein ABEI97_02575, partial [Candidatus Nanohaloarchaea archaeon]
EAADALGVEEATVRGWAESLEDSGLIEVRYSARKGRVLSPVEGEVTEEQLEEARQETEEHLGKVAEFQEGEEELERVQDMLEDLKEELREKEGEALELEHLIDEDHVSDLERFRENVIESEIEIDELEARLDSVIAGLNVMELMAEDIGYDVEEDDGGLLHRIKSAVLPSGGGGTTYTCRDCGAAFDSKHGVKVHRGMMHDD